MIQEIVPRDHTTPCMNVDHWTLEATFFAPASWDVLKGTLPPTRNLQARWNQAKDICSSCPFRDPCLEVALEWEVDGVWGGTDPVERRRLRGDRPGKSLSTGTVRWAGDAA